MAIALAVALYIAVETESYVHRKKFERVLMERRRKYKIVD